MIVPAPQRRIVAGVVPAPWGPVHIAATARGIAGVELISTREAFKRGIERRLGQAVVWLESRALDDRGPDDRGPDDRGPDGRAVEHLRRAVVSLEIVFGAAFEEMAGAGVTLPPPAGVLAALATLPVDLEDRPAWDRMVLEAVRQIPRGEVRSYGEVARAIGRPGAARAVGGAVGRNPIGFIIPCHRVIAGDGTLGGYGGGWWGEADRLLDLKAALLAAEGRILPRSRTTARRGG